MILCCGEALIDMLPCPGREGCLSPQPGGAVFNTAVALGRLGVATGYLGGLSTDLFGARLAAALAAAGVETALAPRSARPTTLAFVDTSAGQPRYAFYDENTAGRCLAPADLPALPARVRALVFGGISLAAEPCGSAFEALQAGAGPGRVSLLDPNIRAAVIADPAAHRARIGRMAARADIVKVSDEDLCWLDPAAAADLEAAARRLLAAGPRLVVLTRGARGALGLTAAHRVAVPARPAALVDTVGAGDTFNAGLLAALDETGALTPAGLAALGRDTLAAALSLGAAAAAVTVGRAGANPPWRHELDG